MATLRFFRCLAISSFENAELLFLMPFDLELTCGFESALAGVSTRAWLENFCAF